MAMAGVSIFTLAIFCGCSRAEELEIMKNSEDMNSTTFFAMDTVMEIQIEGDEELLTEAENMVADLEGRLSVTNESSEIGMLNSNKIGRLSGDSTEILTGALQVCQDTDGALDISIYPVLREWGFTTGEYKIPSAEAIDELLDYVDYSQIQVNIREDGQSDVVLPEDMEIDLGSVVKGYTGELLAQYFKDNGVTSALINLGGNVECLGSKPDGRPWKIAIKSPYPDSKEGLLGVLEAEDVSIITSGGYERFFEEDGKRYWHILNPENGRPADDGLVSVTIVGKDGLRGDGLSTALFVMGLDEAEKYWREAGDFDAIFVTENMVYVTEDIASSFSLTPEYAKLGLKVLAK